MPARLEKKPEVEAGQIWHGGHSHKGYQDSRRIVISVADGYVTYDSYPVRMGEKKTAMKWFRSWAKYVVRRST